MEPAATMSKPIAAANADESGLVAVVIEQQRIDVGEVSLNVAMAGPAAGEPLFFLHGFPEFWYAWHEQMRYFAARGYRVIVPDQRGYGSSDKPAGVAAYRIDNLAGDVLGLADVLGYKCINLVGHDWGGIVAWHLLSWHGERLNKVAVLNAPHLSVWRSAMRRTPMQALKSWYVFAFQVPLLPEHLAGIGGGRFILALSGLDKVLNASDRQRYRRAYTGAMRTMLHWYRAAMRFAGDAGRMPRREIATPLLLLWGRKDRFLAPQLAQQSLALCSAAQLQYLDQAGHWLVHECGREVNQKLATFLQQA